MNYIQNVSNFERALVRIDQFKKLPNIDKETLFACIVYVAKTSNISVDSLVEKLRLNN